MVTILCNLFSSASSLPTTPYTQANDLPNRDRKMFRTKYKWPSLIVYDINFRQEEVANPSTSWVVVHPSMYSQCFTGARKPHTLQQAQPLEQ